MTTNYETQNLYEAAFLLAKGNKLVGKEKNGNKTVVFFEDSEKTKVDALSYYNNGLVSGKKYSDSYRTLKDYIFER